MGVNTLNTRWVYTIRFTTLLTQNLDVFSLTVLKHLRAPNSTLSESRRSQNRLPSVNEGMPDGNVIDIPHSPLRTDDLHLANAKHKGLGKELLLPVTACSSNNFRH
jgi:hypothetical protein